MTRSVVNILLFLSVLVVSGAAVEMGFRFLRPADALTLSMGRVDLVHHHAFRPDSELHLVSSNGEFDVTAHINNFGFRGPDMRLEKAPGRKRVFVVGDSFTFGVGARDDETITQFMQEFWDPRREHIEVVNAGRGHNSPLTYYLRLREELPLFKPDAVIMLLDFSDLYDDWNYEQKLMYDERRNIVGINPYYERGRFSLWNYIRSRSVACAYVHNKVVRTVRKIRKLGWREYVTAKLKGRKAKAVIATAKEETIEFDSRLFLRGRQKAGEIERHFQRTAEYISMCRKLAEQAGSDFILVMYPYGVQVGPNQWGNGRVYWGFEESKVYEDPFSFELVEQFAERERIPFINLWETLRSHRDQRLYFSYDGHFTPAANRIVAHALTQHPLLQYLTSESAPSDLGRVH